MTTDNPVIIEIGETFQGVYEKPLGITRLITPKNIRYDKNGRPSCP